VNPALDDTACALRVEGLSLFYGGFKALDEVDLRVGRGSVHAIIGSNGAGKSSLLQVLAGAIRCNEGHVYLDGRDVTGLAAWRRARLGLSRAFQVAKVFDEADVGDNVAIATACSRRKGFRLIGSMHADEIDGTERALRLLGLSDSVNEPARNLSQGDRKRLEIAMTVASGAEVVLLDEPTAGMSQSEVETTIECMSELQSVGVTVLLIEHDMEVVFSVAQVVTVLDRGRVAYEGTPQEVAKSEQVRSLYLGASAAKLYPGSDHVE
jgi:branched-chain amino acid transport system ATP-binding protein